MGADMLRGNFRVASARNSKDGLISLNSDNYKYAVPNHLMYAFQISEPNEDVLSSEFPSSPCVTFLYLFEIKWKKLVVFFEKGTTSPTLF
jgi:hypothetical protein